MFSKLLRSRTRMEVAGIVGITYGSGVIVTFIGAYCHLKSYDSGDGFDIFSGPFAASAAIMWPIAVPFLLGEAFYNKYIHK
jgi:hypothetical protein